jgi:hypothetical protein
MVNEPSESGGLGWLGWVHGLSALLIATQPGSDLWVINQQQSLLRVGVGRALYRGFAGKRGKAAAYDAGGWASCTTHVI